MARPVDRCLLVFARDPQPGRVKTRLIPALGATGATALYRQMLRDTLSAAANTRAERRELWVDGPEPGPELGRLAKDHAMPLRMQCGADLGHRMHHALSSVLAGAHRAVLIGSDCPQIDPGYLDAALDALDHHELVFGPAADGGYVLIGMRSMHRELFHEMPWGTARVMRETRRRLRRLGLRWHELPIRHDLDRPGDLARFPRLVELAGVGRPKRSR